MVIHVLVYWLLCIFLLGYSIKKFKDTKNKNYLFLSLIELTFIIVQIVTLIMNIELDAFMQILIFIFNFVVPCIILGADFCGSDFDELLQRKLGDRNAKKGRYQKAIEHYKKALAMNNQSSVIYASLGRMYKLSGDRRTAFDRFAKAIELNRNDYKSYYEVGSIFYDMGKYADTRIVLDNSLRIKPDYTPASELLAKSLCKEEKYEEAADVYRSAIRHDVDNYDLYYNLGVVNSELKKFEDAELCYRKAIEINPTMYLAYFGLGQNYYVNNDLDKAEKMFRKAIPGSDTMAKAYFQIAKINMLRGDEIKASNNIASAIEVDSSYKQKAFEEPLFANIREYVIGIATASKYSKKSNSFELSKESVRVVTKKPFDIDRDDEKEQEGQVPMFDATSKINDKLINEEETTKVDEDEVQEEQEQQEEIKEDTSKNNIYKKYVMNKYDDDEEPEQEDSAVEDEEVDEEVEEIEEEPKKKHSKLGFFGKILGLYSDDDDEDDEEDDEQEEEVEDNKEDLYSSVSKVRVVEEPKEEVVEEKVEDFEFDFDKAKQDSKNIYDKFVKLKEEEEEKARRLKHSERIRTTEELKAKADKKEEVVETIVENSEDTGFDFLDRFNR